MLFTFQLARFILLPEAAVLLSVMDADHNPTIASVRLKIKLGTAQDQGLS